MFSILYIDSQGREVHRFYQTEKDARRAADKALADGAASVVLNIPGRDAVTMGAFPPVEPVEDDGE